VTEPPFPLVQPSLEPMTTRRALGYGIAVLALAVAGVWALLIASITNCPSCPTDPCPCSTDYRLTPRAVVIVVGVLVALIALLATRSRSSRPV
jgi:protein-S-isoprenylcysteine O-methyltransferase Ste14